MVYRLAIIVQPIIHFTIIQNQQFDFTPTLLATMQPSRDDPGIVDHQNVAGAQKGNEITELSVRDGMLHPLQVEQPGSVTVRCRGLGNQNRSAAILAICYPPS